MQLVRRDGGRLVLGGRPFHFLLLNAYYLADEVGQGHPEHAREALDAAVTLGARVVRTWGFNDAPWKASRLFDHLEQPHEPGLRALDQVIADAAARQLRLVVALMDYWPWYGGIAQWLAWLGQPVAAAELRAPERYAAPFFTDGGIREIYRRRVTHLLQRKNHLTGRYYADEPTILAWELMNEARGAPKDWIRFAAGCVRSEARQLIALGDETGVEAEGLDLASLHFYPEKHGSAPGCEREWGLDVIRDTASRAQLPLLIGELGLRNNGLSVEIRRDAYDAWFALAAEVGAAGMGPWLLGYRARPASWDEDFTFYLGGDYDAVFAAAAKRFSNLTHKNE